MDDYKIFSWVLQNPENYSIYRNHFNEIQFTDPWVKYAFGLCELVREQVGDIPFDAEQFKYIIRTRSPLAEKPEQLNHFLALIDVLYDKNTICGVDRLNIADHFYNAEKNQIAKSITDFVIIPSPEELRQITNKISRLSDVAYGDSEDWVLPLSEEELMKSPEELDEERGEPISTGLPRWDDALDGGWFRKEQVTFLALPGFGKTLVLLHMAMMVCCQGMRSVFYSMDNPIWETKKKIRAFLSGIPIGTKVTNDEWQRAIEPWLGKFKSDQLIIRNWPRGSKSMEDVARDLKKVIARYGSADMFLIDYLNVMKPVVSLKGQTHEEINQNAMRAAGLAEELNMANIVAAQSEKGGMKVITQDMDNAAGAFAINRHAALMISINQKGADMAQDRIWMGVAKGRRSKTRYKVPLHMDRGTFRLSELDQEYQLMDEDGESRAGIKKSKKQKLDDESNRIMRENIVPIIKKKKEAHQG